MFVLCVVQSKVFMIAIIDYGMGNTGSVLNAFRALGHAAIVTKDATLIEDSTHIVFPGVGAFDRGMENLHASGLIPVLSRLVLAAHKPFLGICLGMQMLASIGEEGGVHEGLGWIPGRVRRFHIPEQQFRLPHVGWNDVILDMTHPLFRDIHRPIFYFVHSYHFVPTDTSTIIGRADYGESFAAVIAKDNIFGVQFHPEKSQRDGLQLLDNFCKLNYV